MFWGLCVSWHRSLLFRILTEKKKQSRRHENQNSTPTLTGWKAVSKEILKNKIPTLLLMLNGLQFHLDTVTENIQISIYILKRSGFSDDMLNFLPTIQTHQWSLTTLSVWNSLPWTVVISIDAIRMHFIFLEKEKTTWLWTSWSTDQHQRRRHVRILLLSLGEGEDNRLAQNFCISNFLFLYF